MFSVRIWIILCITVFATILGCSPTDKSAELLLTINANPIYKTWSHYLGDPQRTYYSVLNEIDTNNVHLLKPSWQYQSGLLEEQGNSQIQPNPLIIENILYGINPYNSLFALNADTGVLLWEFTPENQDKTGLGLSRALTAWISGSNEPGRIFYASGHRLYTEDLITVQWVSLQVDKPW